MKKMLSSAAVAMIVIAMAGLAGAGTLNPAAVPVDANVTGKCSIVTEDAALNFGALDPETDNIMPAAISGSLTVKCTKGHPFTVDAASGNAGAAAASCSGAGITGVLADGSGNQMNYTFTCSAGSGNGFGAAAAVSLAPAASIDMASYRDAVVGAYNDSVTLTINY